MNRKKMKKKRMKEMIHLKRAKKKDNRKKIKLVEVKL